MVDRMILSRLKHRVRLSPIAIPYWERRRRKIRTKGTYAQHGEDLLMLDLVEDNGTYLDIGANHPFLISNNE